MKKFVALILALTMVFALCGCVMKKEEIPSFLDELADKAYTENHNDKQLAKRFQKATKNDEFDSVVSFYLEECSEADEFEKCVNIAGILDYYAYNSESIRNQFNNCVDRERSLLFQERDDRMSNFIETIEEIKETSYYLSIIDFFPYEEMKEAITTNADLVICEIGSGGFYDTNDGEEKDESYWWSPLLNERARSGEVGYEKITKFNLFAGDFDVTMRTEVFYGTSPGDYGNSTSASLYYKGILISSNYNTIDNFLSMCSTGNVFYWGNGESDNVFFIIGNDKITVYNGELFDIQYYS